VAPEWGLIHMQRALWDPVDPHQLGSLSADLQFRVNGEVYRFATERNLRRFMLAPTRWCGPVRDPVTGRVFQPHAGSAEAYWIGGPYYFESDSSKARFVEDPHRFEVIRQI
jgi:YHS domain-containing protein